MQYTIVHSGIENLPGRKVYSNYSKAFKLFGLKKKQILGWELNREHYSVLIHIQSLLYSPLVYNFYNIGICYRTICY
jgi:hypothetical protein